MLKAKALILALVLLAGCIACILSIPLVFAARQKHRNAMREKAMAVTMKQAEPLIEAINRYRKDHGKPPVSLHALIPRYLTIIPEPGALALNGWHYRANEDAAPGDWEMFVCVRGEYSPNTLGFGDRFVFLPDGNYPRLGYGGVLERVGKWGYYIEYPGKNRPCGAGWHSARCIVTCLSASNFAKSRSSMSLCPCGRSKISRFDEARQGTLRVGTDLCLRNR